MAGAARKAQGAGAAMAAEYELSLRRSILRDNPHGRHRRLRQAILVAAERSLQSNSFSGGNAPCQAGKGEDGRRRPPHERRGRGRLCRKALHSGAQSGGRGRGYGQAHQRSLRVERSRGNLLHQGGVGRHGGQSRGRGQKGQEGARGGFDRIRRPAL